jgi:hypothetical protein
VKIVVGRGHVQAHNRHQDLTGQPVDEDGIAVGRPIAVPRR